MGLAGLMFILLNVYLPVCTLVLLVLEWKSRRRCRAYDFRLPASAAVLLILLCASVSEFFLWMGFLEWVEAAASV